MQVGGSVVAIADPGLRRYFQRILVWCVVSGLFALGGGLVHGNARIALWAGAVLVDGAGAR
jgi:low temperature requirement protein LtrA